MTNTEFIKKYDMLPEGVRVLCAVSGGKDSMCLLHMLRDMGTDVVAAHFNHMIRGAEADRDEAFVLAWCAENGIECVTGHGNVPQFAEKSGVGTEEAARMLRYAFLADAAKKHGCDKIATAHNSDDNAETVLFNLIRGSGAKGLCGIPPVRGNIIRPLLCMSRAEIESYNEQHGVPNVEDSTNSGDDYTRNLIRHKLLPVMKEINPAFEDAFLRSGETLREDNDCLNAIAKAYISDNLKDSSLPVEGLRALPRPVCMRVFRQLCGGALTKKHADSIYALLDVEGLAFCDVHGMRIAKDTGRLYFGAKQRESLGEYELSIGGETRIPELRMRVVTEIIECCADVHKFDFNYDSVCGKISLTSRRDGDKIRLPGRGCTKSLKELFREKGIPNQKRGLIPVLRDEKGVIGVVGFGTDERCAAKAGDKVLRIKFIPTGEK